MGTRPKFRRCCQLEAADNAADDTACLPASEQGRESRAVPTRRRGCPTFVRTLCAAMLAAACLTGRPCSGQVQLPNTYGQYYQSKIPSYSGPGIATSNKYLYDKYFYQRPTVSPYINIGRRDTDFGTNYQAYIRPELERREASAAAQRAYVQQRKLEGRVGETRYPGAGFVGASPSQPLMKPSLPTSTSPSSYYNHWYGNWAGR